MESRLPKPKIIIGKSVITMDTNVKINNQKATKDENTISASTSAGTKSLQENKLQVKQTLVRAKTLASITRPNNTKGIKRQATTITHGEPKKPFVKPTVKAVVNKPNSNGLANNKATNKVTQNNTENKAGKIQKWDLRGRLAHTSDKLSAVQQKNKDIESKYNELQKLTSTLQANEALYREKSEKFEDLNKILTADFESLTEKVSALKKNNEELAERLRESEKSLSEYQKKCKLQETTLEEQTKQLTIMKTDLESTKERNKALTSLKEELESLTHKLDKERRILHNNIQDLKGNIRVFCRVRPRTSKEIELMKMPCSINFIDDCTIEISKLDISDGGNYCGKSRMKQEFSFDKVFTPNASQEDIFEELALLVQSALEGYNVCVFAYGQTGSGKTYTMEGEHGLQTEGMIPRTIRHIFKEMRQFQLLGWEYRIEASFLEIYNEHIVDLLESQPKTHEIRMVDSKGQDLYVSNLRIEEIHSPEEIHECLQIAQSNRAVAATQSNERSSRSHYVARIRLIGKHIKKGEVSIGNLNLVDLAGSERLKSEQAVRTAETKNINKSLSNLGNVILALLKKQEHIPYRNSKLTHLLMPSLGGNSKTLMLLNISPLDECYSETLNSLRFGSSVNSCKTGTIKRSRTDLKLNND